MTHPNRQESSHSPACDLLFIGAAALFAWLAAVGSVDISAGGAVMDSDLETYAQAMAGERQRTLFAADPALSAATAANGIPNLQRILASWLAPNGQEATGLLRAGGIAIFIFYTGWYALGRYLFTRPVLAAILALCCGVTIWIGWGTFWGVLHSNPVPRVFFAAILPFLLLLFFRALKNPRCRPPTMLLTGLCIWIHGVSALNCGAMFFTAFMLIPPRGARLSSHFFNLLLCLGAFLAPTLVFLWPSLSQGHSYGAEELAIFQQLFNLRWQADYGNFAKRILHFISPAQPVLPIIIGGIIGWGIIKYKNYQPFSGLLKAAPAFACGLVLVAAFCWLETSLAPKIGRLPMGHELIRGLRFLVPISWLLIVAGVSLISGKWSQRAILIFVMASSLFLSRDQQYIAAQYAFTKMSGISLPLSGLGAKQAAKAAALAEVFQAVHNIVPATEPIFCPEDVMPVRYLALRPLGHSFKDGYLHFYNKDKEGSAHWLRLESTIRDSGKGWETAWQESGAPWLLLPPSFTLKNSNAKLCRIIHGWSIIHRL